MKPIYRGIALGLGAAVILGLKFLVGPSSKHSNSNVLGWVFLILPFVAAWILLEFIEKESKQKAFYAMLGSYLVLGFLMFIIVLTRSLR